MLKAKSLSSYKTEHSVNFLRHNTLYRLHHNDKNIIANYN